MHIPDQESRGHVSPTRVYYIVGSALLALTVITVLASLVHWGKMVGVEGLLVNVIIAMIIATIKASLVLVYFMHMKYESKLIWGMGIIYPLILFGIMIGFMSLDVFKRVDPEAPAPKQVLQIERSR